MNSSASTWQSGLITLHAALLRRRPAVGLTQQQLADRLSVDRRTIQRWEDGSCDPSSQDLFRWADALGFVLFAASAEECDTSAASELARSEPDSPLRPAARRRLPSARTIRLCRSTAMSTSEQARAYQLLVVEGRTHAAVAATLTAERAHGAAPVGEDEVRALFAAERAVRFRDRFHDLPRQSLDGENATERRSVHGKTKRAVSPSRSGAGR